MDEGMIGMALGSPSHPPFPQSNVHGQLDPKVADTGAPRRAEGSREAKSSNAKANKWKMFGGLFKPKHNTSGQAPPPGLQLSEQQPTGQDIGATKSKSIPLQKDTSQPYQAPVRHESTPMNGMPVEGVKDSAPTIPRTQLTKLEIAIPDGQMDRYSVMFGDFLDGQNSTSLLSRRSKVLERLKTTSDEDAKSQDSPTQQSRPDNAGLPYDMAQSEEHEQLKPPPSTRRATSPTPGKSPVFSLFPQPPTTPRRAAAITLQSRPTPLQRSFTAPSRLSPMEEIFGMKKPEAMKSNHMKRRKSSVSLVETSASTTQGPGWSTDGSYLSPNSSVSSVGDEILFDIKKLSMVTENQEPQYEVTKPDGETVDLYRALSKKVKASKPPALKLASKYAKVEATKSSVPKPNESVLRGFDAAGTSKVEGATGLPPTTAKSLTSEDLLPSTRFMSTTQTVGAAKTKSLQDLLTTVAQIPKPLDEVNNQPVLATKPTVVLVSKTPTGDKKRPAPPPSQPMTSDLDSLIESEEFVEARQDILAAAVLGTLDHMGEQSSIRAASPMPPESPELRASTPVEKPVKLLVIPKNIPISKYSLRSPTAASFKADLGSRSASPQPRRAVTEPLVHDQSFTVRPTRLQASTISDSRGNKKRSKPNTSSKIVTTQPKGNSKIQRPKPDLGIVAPKPTARIGNSEDALSPVEVTVARQVSLSRKQSKRLLIAPPGRRMEGLATDDGEKVVNTQALMPVIVDANKAHRPGKSLALVIENA